MRDIVIGNDDHDDVDKVQCDAGIATPKQTYGGPEAPTMNQNDATLDTGAESDK